MFRFALFAVLFVSTQLAAFAQVAPPKAVIKGSKEVLAGTLLFLSYEDAVGDNKVWLIPDELKENAATCQSNIFFSIPKPGVYKFGLIVANKEAAIDYCWHEVTVKGGLLPPEKPVDPVVPTPIPDKPNYFEKLKEASKVGSQALGDPATATKLAATINSTATSAQNLPLSEATLAMQQAITIVLATRTRESFRTKDWESRWRRPVNEELKLLNPTDTLSYIAAMRAAADGICTTCTTGTNQ